ncbi:hypothetical protein C8R47DRAFT_1128815, partial [Mycena vitilis]
MTRRKTEMACPEGTLPRGRLHSQKESNDAMAELRKGGRPKLPTGDPRLKRTTSQMREPSSSGPPSPTTEDSIIPDANVAALEVEFESLTNVDSSSDTDSMALDVEVAALEAETNRTTDPMRGEHFANLDFTRPTVHAIAHRSQCYLVYDYTVCPFVDPEPRAVDPREEAENELARLWTQSLTIGQEPHSHVDGEQIERGWADLAACADSTRMMGPRRRHAAVHFSDVTTL